MAPGYVFQVSLWVTIQNQIRIAQRVVVDAQLVLGGEIEHYLSLGCDHGRLEE